MLTKSFLNHLGYSPIWHETGPLKLYLLICSASWVDDKIFDVKGMKYDLKHGIMLTSANKLKTLWDKWAFKSEVGETRVSGETSKSTIWRWKDKLEEGNLISSVKHPERAYISVSALVSGSVDETFWNSEMKHKVINNKEDNNICVSPDLAEESEWDTKKETSRPSSDGGSAPQPPPLKIKVEDIPDWEDKPQPVQWLNKVQTDLKTLQRF